MSDLINRKTVISVAESCTFTFSHDRTRYMDFLNYCLNTAPTVDAVPVVHGEWIKDNYGNTRCSRCMSSAMGTITGCLVNRHYETEETNFCPVCGADMRGEKND